MRRSRRPIVIASRQSRLARAQARAVGSVLAKLHPGIEVTYQWVESEGDRSAQDVLAQIGGKGLFVRSIEKMLLRGDADLAVHSLKDLPVNGVPGLALAAIAQRGSVEDCLISPAANQIMDLPQNARLGTASPRRAAQVRRLRPDLQITHLRGNVETRLAKVIQEQQVDATILAAVGLERCGLAEHATKRIDVQQIMPAASQGALAIQCRADDHVSITRCLPLNHAATAEAVHVERQVVAELGGECHLPIAVLTQTSGHRMRLRCRVMSVDGQQFIETDQAEPRSRLKRLVQQTLKSLRQQGAEQILQQVRQQS